MSEGTVHDWLNRAIVIAAQEGEVIAPPEGNRCHDFRSNGRIELRKVDPKYARFLVGQSVRTGTPGITLSEGRYLRIVPEDLVEAVLIGTGPPNAGKRDAKERGFSPVPVAVQLHDVVSAFRTTLEG